MIRLIKTAWKTEQLDGKSIWASFVTTERQSFEGKGKIRVAGPNPDGEIRIDVVFTLKPEPYKAVDIIFHLSEAQADRIKPASSEPKSDYVYEGLLQPDPILATKN